MEFDKSLTQLLVEVSFVAAQCGHSEEAIQIADAVAIIRPKSELVHIPAIMGLLSKGKPEEAVERGLKVVLPLNPESILTRFFLGLAYDALGGKPDEVKKYLEPLAKECPDKGMQEIAAKTLEGLEKKDTKKD